MTIEKMKSLAYRWVNGDPCTVREGEAQEYHRKVLELLEKEEKYKWHDLRKNPDDLPQEDGLYIIAAQYNVDPIETGFGQYENMYGYGSGWSAMIPSARKVIAWREIEPFEED